MNSTKPNGRPTIALAQIVQLLEAYNAGASASSVAARIGVSRNTAINYFSIFRANYKELPVLGCLPCQVSFMISADAAADLSRKAEKRKIPLSDLMSLIFEEINRLNLVDAIAPPLPDHIGIRTAIKEAREKISERTGS